MKSKATKWRGKWIWHPVADPCGYNECVSFRKDFHCVKTAGARLKITADSRYRVSVNGVWINDGPGRAYPEHFTYDVHEIGGLLRKGKNRIDVIVRYFGVGTFHQVPQRGGLLAQIECEGRVTGTDASWKASLHPALATQVPKVSVQMEPVEKYDARLAGKNIWIPAAEVCPAEAGPWKDLQPRRSLPMTKNRHRPVRFCGAVKLEREPGRVCVPVTRIAHPGVVETNVYTSRPVILASVLVVKRKASFDFSSPFWRVAVGGKLLKNGKVVLPAGRHMTSFFFNDFYNHIKERGFPFKEIAGGQWEHPWSANARHPWVVAVLKDCLFLSDDRIWLWFKNPEAEAAKARYEAAIVKLAAASSEPERFRAAVRQSVRAVPAGQLFLEDFTADFEARKPLRSALRQVDLPVGNSAETVVRPVKNRDIELCYDLGCQRCGYLDFEISAAAGTVVDLHLVEHITPEGVIQHTAESNRNGLRYITAKGTNRYTSLKRRSGRFLFVTLRNQRGPVGIRSLSTIESTADVSDPEPFRCNDETLNRIWEISERTLKLCMEDVFTDCPLYEQTLWIGDARNEAIYALRTYGDRAVSARSLELGAQSLAHFPIVGCQVPSEWDCLLPAWSFLWGMHVWEHYFHTGDLRFLKQLWPAALKNFEGAMGFLDRKGLFNAPFWNLFEWAPIDHEHSLVLHNSLLLAAMLGTMKNCAEVLGDKRSLKRLAESRRKLVAAVNRTWNAKKKSYPDAIADDGTPSAKTGQHTSILAVLAGAVPQKNLPAVLKNLLHPPAEMTRIGSPFGAQFLFEALAQLGRGKDVISLIRKNYTPMIEEGATTVWETYPGSTCSPPGFPTRSHCHGWSCAPLQFFNEIVLGIRQTKAGGTAFEISPELCGLRRASGSTATPRGPIHVEWSVRGGVLEIRVNAPAGVDVRFVRTPAHRGLKIRFRRRENGIENPLRVGG